MLIKKSERLYIGNNEQNISCVMFNFTIDFLSNLYEREKIENNIVGLSYTVNKIINSLLDKSLDINYIYIDFLYRSRFCNNSDYSISINIITNNNKLFCCDAGLDFLDNNNF